MTKTLMIVLTAAALGLSGCASTLTGDQATAAGALAGGAAGLAITDAVGGSGTAKAVGTLAGAAAGAALAADAANKQCRYANGRIGPCPAGY